MSVYTLRLLVLHELTLLVRNKKLVWSHAFTVVGGFALFAATVERGVAPLVPPFFMILLTFPAGAVPAAIGVHMFVGEKERRTMEPLLLLPVSLRALLGAKFATMFAVSVGELVLFFLAGVAILRTLTSSSLYSLAVNSTTTYIAAVLIPLLGVLIGLIAIIVSSRATSTQSATQTMMFVFIPLMALLSVLSIEGLTIITRSSLVSGTIILLILNVVGYGFAVGTLTPEALIRKRGQ